MTAANAVSKRRRFRYPHRLRRYAGFKKWNTVALPKAPLIDSVTALAGGINKILLRVGYGQNSSLQPVVEISNNGTSGWTNQGITAWTYPNIVLTTSSVVAGVKYFRVSCVNSFGQGPPSNVVQATVLA